MTDATPQHTGRGHRRERLGEVVSDAMDKTIVVRVERRIRHALYGKEMRSYTKFHAHDEKNEAHKGDRVRIVETRPLSRLKRWRLLEIVSRGTTEGGAVS
ncbi:MAG: 30S ribosomal protein S17 [Verrucomicrobia bacterium A1]|nr:MAG: 30S ribosomal protein S17 [Verrucomicrobia bacterium A1]